MTPLSRAPHIGVVMRVHNGEQFLADAISSILRQTYANFELIVVDDGCTDGTGMVLARFSDPRIRVIRFPVNRGMVEAMNCGMRESHSELIACMDSDDLSMPRRFERQVAFMEAHPEIAVCGTWTRSFGSHRGLRRLPVDPEHIRAHMFFGGAIDHSSLMMRRAFIEQNGLTYDDAYRWAEDLDFLIRAANFGKLSNVPEVLLMYRTHGCQASVLRRREQLDGQRRLLVRQLRLLIPDAGEDEDFHIRLATEGVKESELGRVERWLLRLDRANRESARYDLKAFGRELRRNWFYAHAHCHPLAPRRLRSYWNSPLRRVREIGVLRHLRLVLKSLVPRLAGWPRDKQASSSEGRPA